MSREGGRRALDGVVERIVTGYEPDRIILFGSQAREGSGSDGDIDLLIVKGSGERPADRRLQVERLLADRKVALDLLVYTPTELLDLYATGSPFIEEVVRTGEVLYMRKVTGVWLRESLEEHEMGRVLFDHGHHRGACLHAQQSVEKGLKAYLLERGVKPPWTHDLLELRRSVITEGWEPSLPIDELIYLNSIDQGRYPTEAGLLPLGEPTEDDARRALAAAANFASELEAQLR